MRDALCHLSLRILAGPDIRSIDTLLEGQRLLKGKSQVVDLLDSEEHGS